jgi:peptide/nickel transport system permease protein
MPPLAIPPIMIRRDYLIKKTSWSILTILFVLVLNFFLFRILPGDPTTSIAKDPRLTADAREGLTRRFGLDRPLLLNLEGGNPFDSQFFIYFGRLFHGDLGTSYNFNRPVADLLGERLWNTVLLVMGGQILAIVLGIGLGLLAAWKNKTSLDTAAITFSLAAWSLPTFWLGILLLIIGSIYLGLPTAGRETVGLGLVSGWDRALDVGKHLLLPTLTFTIVLLGEYMLIMRSSVLEILSEDYILTAKAKGLGHLQILRKHALPNAMLPIVTLIALNLGFTVSGAIQVETVFSWPGLGSMIYEAVRRQDYPVLQGAFLLVAVSVVLANLIADLVYGYLDPRVKAA